MKPEPGHILVVGGTGGIGRVITSHLLEKGYKVTVTTRNPSSAPPQTNAVHLDLLTSETFQSLDKVGKIDGLVYLPGVVQLYPVKYLTPEKLDGVRKIVYDGAVMVVSTLLRQKKVNPSASLVFISSVSSNFPYKGGAAYCSSKAALEVYSKVLALELASQGIRSNCVKAGLVESPILDDTIANMPEDLYEQHVKSYPLGLGRPSDVASAVEFLLSGDSRWITGTELVLDGGLTAGV